MKLNFDEKILIKLPKEMKDRAEEIAQSNSQSLSAYIRALILKDIKEY